MRRVAEGRRRGALAVCLLIALALHLLVLLAWPRAEPGAAAPTAPAAQRVLNLQLALPTGADPTVSATPEPMAAEPTPRPASAPMPPANVPSANPPVAAASPLAIEPDWWPREQLDEGPRPLTPVLYDSARAGNALLPVGANVLLHVDERGRVQQVEFGGSPLPEEVEAVLREAFEATPFEPGRRNGQPVRSKVRVALERVIDTDVPAR